MPKKSFEDTIYANGGQIIGSPGDDTIYIDSGDNRVIGGNGNDTFIYKFANHIGTGTSNNIEGANGNNILLLDLNDVPNAQTYAQNIYNAFQQYLAGSSREPFDIIAASGMEQPDISFVVHNIDAIYFNPIIANQSADVYENTEEDTTIHDLDAFDPDTAVTFTYSITAGNELNKFEIVSTTGEITLEDELDFESPTDPNPYVLTIEIQNSNNLTSEVTLEINVIDVGEYGVSFKEPEISVKEGEETATFTVELTEPVRPEDTVRVTYETQDGTAEDNEDYKGEINELKFLPGESSKEIEIKIYDDDEAEGEEDENFFVQLSNAEVEGIGSAYIIEDEDRAECFIEDNDYIVSMQELEVERSEGDPPAEPNFRVVVTLNRAVSEGQQVKVDYETFSEDRSIPNMDPATEDKDYESKSGTLIFDHNEDEAEIVVKILSDTNPENNEYFFVELTDVQVIGGGTATIDENTTMCIIQDDDNGNNNDDLAGFTQGTADTSVVTDISTLVMEDESLDLQDVTSVNLEQIDMQQDSSSQTLTLSVEDVLRVSQNDQLIIKGSTADSVESSETWSSTGNSTTIDSVAYNEYVSGDATLLIQADVNISGLIN